jgi:hypothetical protein
MTSMGMLLNGSLPPIFMAMITWTAAMVTLHFPLYLEQHLTAQKVEELGAEASISEFNREEMETKFNLLLKSDSYAGGRGLSSAATMDRVWLPMRRSLSPRCRSPFCPWGAIWGVLRNIIQNSIGTSQNS